MTQQTINLGAGPDSQTGDTLYTAFAKTNENFTELYSVFGANGITTINANVIYSNSIVASANIRAGNLFSYGNIETIGYVVTAGAFYPNGVAIGTLTSIESNLLPSTSNLYTIGSSTKQFTQGYFSTNLTLAGANVTVVDGQILINGIVAGNYGNANVARYLPTYTGNLAAGQINDITGSAINLASNNYVQLQYDPTGNYDESNITTGSWAYIGDGGFFFQSNVTGIWKTVTLTDAGNINADGDVTVGGNLFVGGNITYQNVETGNLEVANTITASGNITASYFLGNGRYLSGIDATSIQNGTSNVKVYSNSNVEINTTGTYKWAFDTAGRLLSPDGTQNYGATVIAPADYDIQSIANTYIQTSAAAGAKTWVFDRAGNLTAPGNITTSANIAANYFIGNFVGNISGNISAVGANTQVLFNDNGTVNSTSGLTFNKASNLVTVGGTLSATQVNVAGFNVIDSTGNIVTSQLVNSGVTAGTYGNASSVPSITVDSKGRVTAVSNVAVAGVSNVTYNTTTGNLTVSTSSGTNYIVGLGVGTVDSPIFSGLSVAGNATVSALTVNANATFGGTLGVTGNINGTSATLSGSIVTTGPAQHLGGIQATPIGNVAPSTALFTTVGTSGNLTTSALTVNANASIGGTLSVTGNLTAGNLSATNFVGNAIALGTNTAGQLVSNAVTLTSSTSITNGIAQLNYVLGKLVPTAPNNFPGGQSLAISTLSSYRMANFVQTDNTATGSKSVAGGTLVSNVRRANTYTTSTIANVGPGDTGIVTSYRNGVGVGNVTLIAGNVSGTYGNLVITRSGDYANVANITPGFWYSFSSSLSGTVPAGWNEVYIGDSATGNTNIPYWYYDASAPGTPTWSNTSIALTTNSSTYSSTIPHLNSSSQFTLAGNVSKLSGDMFPSGASSNAYAFITGTAGGAFAAPASVTYAQANVTWPLAQNLYVSSGSAYLTTTAAVTTGFGSSATGPSLTADNSYLTGAAAFSPGVTVLYKTGTANQIEETSIVVTSVGTGSGNALRVVNPGSTNTPVIAANTAFNSQSSTLQTYDTTVVAAVLKHDQTNYSTGYLPVGPNLSTGRTGDQYFTFKFTRTVVSKFDISVTGNVAGCWVALPGSSIDTTSSLNGWIDMSTAYAGSGIPGANIGAGGNGSNGCALGGTFTTNSSVTQSKTCTFGTVSSSSTVSSEIFVRLRLVAGQTVTALSIVTATH